MNLIIGLLIILFSLISQLAYADNVPETIDSEDTSILHKPSSENLCGCQTKHFGPDIETYRIRNENFPKYYCKERCVFTIYPNPQKTIEITITTMNISPKTAIKFFQFFDVKNSTFYIEQKTINGEMKSYRIGPLYRFNSAVNSGYFIEFIGAENTESLEKQYAGFSLEFRRLDADPRVTCETPMVVVDGTPTLIQNRRSFNLPSGCVYTLVPKWYQEDDEMLITIGPESTSVVYTKNKEEDGDFRGSRYVLQPIAYIISAKNVELHTMQETKDYRGFELETITAKLINKTCHCTNEFVKIHGLGTSWIRSPGHPHYNCPGRTCTNVVFGENIDIPGYTSMFSIMIEYQMNEGSTFKFGNDKKIYFINELETEKFGPIFIRDDVLRFSFETHTSLGVDKFSAKITRVLVDEDCVCSTYRENIFNEPGKHSVLIPGKCEAISCYFIFFENMNQVVPHSFEITFSLPSSLFYDELTISDPSGWKKYGQLSLERGNIHISEEGPISMLFNRSSAAKMDSVLTFSWTTNQECQCGPTSYFVDTDLPLILTSPNFPQPYCSDLNCHYKIFATNGQKLLIFVEKLELDINDHLEIYDGESIAYPLLGQFSEQCSNVHFNSTDSQVFLKFFSDSGSNGLGFKIYFVADQPLFPVKELFFLLLIMLICFVLCSVAYFIFTSVFWKTNCVVRNNKPTADGLYDDINSSRFKTYRDELRKEMWT